MGVLRDIQRDLNHEVVTLFGECHDALLSEARVMCNDDSGAEDLVMRTFEAYCKSRDKFDPEKGSWLSWLKGIMRNLHHNSSRGKAIGCMVYMTPEELARIQDCEAGSADTEDAVLKNSDAEFVRNAVAGLSQDMREVIVLKYFEDLPISRIAQILGASENSVKCRLYYARKVLVKRLGEKLGRKPFAVLLAALLGIGTLFGAWVSPLGDWVAEKVFGSAPAVEAVSAQGVDDFSDNKQNETPQVGDQQQVADSQVQEGEQAMNIKSAFTNTLAAAAVAAAGLGASAETEIGSSPADNLEALPAEYARVDYLCSAGDANAGNAPYIDLEYKATEKTGLDMDFEVMSVGANDYPCPFGACHANFEKAFILKGSSSTFTFQWATVDASTQVGFSVRSIGRHEINVRGCDWTLDGETKSWPDGEPFALNCNLYVFARNNNGTMDRPTNMKLFGLKIYEGDELKRCFVPCVRVSDGVPGLYDCVSGAEKKFYTKSGSGAFTFPMPKHPEIEAAGLPAEYIRVGYLYSAGNVDAGNAPYIDLEYKATEKTGLSADFKINNILSANEYPCPFGACHANFDKTFILKGSPTTFSFQWATASASLQQVFSVPTLGRHEVNVCGGFWILDSEAETWPKSESFALNCNLYVFARNNNGTMDRPANMALYVLRIYEGFELKHYFVPCVRVSDGEPGLYDCVPGVAKAFYTNAGSGALECPTPISVDCIPAYVSDKPIYKPHPRVRRTLDSSVLAEETDYALLWSDDGNGAGCVTVSGKGAYDSAKVSYQFVGQSEETFSVKPILPQTYSAASVCMPRPKVRTFDGSRMLAEGTDYDLYWYDNWKIGQGYVVVVGKGEFAGKTWTEPFQILPRLKGGYKAVSYIKSSGTQYINTGFKPNVTTRADIHFDMEDFAGTLDFASPFGSRNVNTSQFFVFASSECWYRRFCDGAKDTIFYAQYLQKPSVAGEHLFSLNRNDYWLDGFAYQFGLSQPFATTYDAYVFASNDNDVPTRLAPMKLYSLRIWDNGTLVRDFIPCVNDKGEAGLYDLTPGATKVFYPNDGSDAFEVGPKAETRGLVVMFW